MKTFSVDKNSWHYKLNVKMVKTNERLNRDDRAEIYVQSKDNLCSYWQMTLWSVFKVAVAVSFVIVLVGFVMFTLYNLGYAFMFHTTNALIGTGILLAAVTTVTGIVSLMTWISRRKTEKLNKILFYGETETSLTKAQYSSWKNGVCVPVEFKE
jgi:hypothetical protein